MERTPDREENQMSELRIERFESPSETRTFEKGHFELVEIGGVTVGRASYEPGWKWSEHVGPTAGTDTCQVEHVGLVVSGQAAVLMDDGTETVMKPGDLFYVPPGHDSWVVGDEPYVSLHFLGADEYASE
jgi:quercetin dioxygenase-like cupin family protein